MCLLTLEMFATLVKPFFSPSYVGGLVHVFAEAPSPVPTYNGLYNKQVLCFFDVEAKQSKDRVDSCSPSC